MEWWLQEISNSIQVSGGSFYFISATSVDLLPKVSYGTLSKFCDDKNRHSLTRFKIVLSGATRVRIYQYEFQISVHFVRE